MSMRTIVTLERPLGFDSEGVEGTRAVTNAGTHGAAPATLTEAYPPPPHDPRDRELAMVVGGWEARLFGGRKREYFVTRGFWHVQLWHPDARVSLLTPSRLTCGLYEAFPVANWKAQAPDYAKLASLIAGMRAVRLPTAAEMVRIERALVHDVVRASAVPVS